MSILRDLSPMPTLDERRRMCELTTCTINGNPARISGAKNRFATVTDTTTGLSCEFAWQVVDRVTYNGGRFRS